MVLTEFWMGLDRPRRAGFVAGLATIVGITALLAFWLLRTDYDVLFANLAPQDAATMTTELDRMKLPYRLGADGTSILVDRSTVHATRLKLMGKDMPLHGAVGFELFNNTDFGMTEFAQKINYQRAMQGEITRTILSLAEVESARVHLAFPEDGLFKRDQAKAKAAITLALRHGQTLRPEQVSGIQRLVAAAVTGIAASDVTIVDPHGIALTRATAADTPGVESAGRLELKAEIERALTRKAAAVLDRTFGEGRVLASVDVALDMNQVRVTTEDVRGQGDKSGEGTTGVVVRERETLRDDSAVVSVRDGMGGGAGSSFRETEYQVGRRVEQVITQPGSIQKLQVVAVVKDPLDAEQLAQVKALIGASVGANPQRGDTVVVHSIGAFSGPQRSAADPVVPAAAADESNAAAASGVAPRSATRSTDGWVFSPLGLALIAVLALLVMTVAIAATGRRSRSATLSAAERDLALAKVRQWLNDGAPTGAGVRGEMS